MLPAITDVLATWETWKQHKGHKIQLQIKTGNNQPKTKTMTLDHWTKW